MRTLRTMHCISAKYLGSPSRGSALRTIAAAADLLQAKACAVISPESSSIEPEWIDRLLSPVCRQGFEFVTPVYRRHKFDGMLVTNLLYPMTRAMYGLRIREPNPAEFAFSGGFGTYLVGHELWRQESANTSSEMCLTLAAITGGYKLHQSFLGAKGHSEGTADLVLAMRQTVGWLFWSLNQYFSIWSAANETKPVPAPQPEYEWTTDPVRVDVYRLHQMFCSGISDLEAVLTSILSRSTFDELKHAAALGSEQFKYPDELWVRTVYEFAAAYHRSVISRDHIIQALVPLYRGRIYTFLMQNAEASAAEVEQNIESLCLSFEQMKPNLLEMWQRKEGGT